MSLMDWAINELDLIGLDEDGYPGIRKYKSYFSNRDSRKFIEFPYTPETEYVERKISEE